MARKRVKRYDDGGEIIVTGQRENQVNMDTLDRLMRSRGGGGFAAAPGGGGAPSQRFVPAPLPQPSKNVRFGKSYSPMGPVYGAEYSGDGFSVSGGLGKGLIGKEGAPKIGVSGRLEFKKGGKVKKMAKGGSTASKRADGIATKGKTKGRFV